MVVFAHVVAAATDPAHMCPTKFGGISNSTHMSGWLFATNENGAVTFPAWPPDATVDLSDHVASEQKEAKLSERRASKAEHSEAIAE
jgi:hypothetical protein